METNAGMDYTYTYPNAPAGVAPEHGVRQVTGGIGYNGTVTIRAKRGTGCTTSPEMKLYVNGTLREQWTVNKSSYWNYTKNTGMTTDAQVDVVFTNAYSGCTLQVDYVTIPTATGTRTVQAESGGTIFDRGSEAGAPGANAFDGVNVINGAELMSENGSLRFVVGLNALAAGYDANGNMTLRLKDGARYFLEYDAENRLTSISGTVSASFAYNGDGQRVSATIDTTITTYIGGYFEWQAGAGTSYYFAGAQRIAMRTGTDVKYLLGDHLGSTSVTALASGAFDTETRYYPWGGVRWSSGPSPTDYLFTGQQEVASIGLYFFKARFYDAALGRFVSPDTIIPQQQGSQAWDRYAGMNNNPVRYVDPSGHSVACGIGKEDCEAGEDIASALGDTLPLNASIEETLSFPDELTPPQKAGMIFTTLMVEVFIVAPFELTLISLSLACIELGPLGIPLHIVILAAEITVVDFGISLLINTKESIESGHKGEFKWNIIPSIVSDLPEFLQEFFHDNFPGVVP